jgi:predicted dehydrogenase
MADKRLRIGVIGVGIMGERHARVAAALPHTQLVAVVDVNPVRVAEISAAHGVPGYTDYRDMLAKEELDAVAVATADQFHKAPTVDALRMGLAVFLEKPVASTLADAEAIQVAARETGGKVMVGHTLRYDSRYGAVAQAAKEGKIGDVIHIYARRNATTWSGRRIGGRASVTVFQGVHDFDVIRWITGAEVVRAYGVAASKALTDLGVADTVMATLELSNGGIAQVEQSWGVPYGVPSMLDARMEVVGTKGAAYIDMTPQCLSLFTDGKFTQPDTIYSGAGLHILKDMYAQFLAYVEGTGEAVATLEDGIAALKIALAVDESVKTGRPVDL